MSALTVSLGQINVQKGSPRQNWEKVQAVAAEAGRRGADAVIFPELWDAGVSYDKAKDFASSLSGGLFTQVVALSRQHNVHILGSMFEKRGVGIYNTMAVFSPRSAVLGAYRKMHLFSLMGEDKWLAPGEAPLTMNLPWGLTGFAICYDLRFPELFRRYATDGAQVVIMCAEWPHPRLDHYRTLLRARAIENQCYMIAVNRVGTDNDTQTRYFGHSCVIDPWGEIVVEAGETEAHLTVTLDLAKVDQVRRDMPVLDARRL